MIIPDSARSYIKKYKKIKSFFGQKCYQICRQSRPICSPGPFRQPVMCSVGGWQMWPIHLPEAQDKGNPSMASQKKQGEGLQENGGGEMVHIPPASV